ncbi:MAG: cupin domain-containing protein [Planctomycetota bacterium]
MTASPLHRRAREGHWISWLGAPTQFLALGEETGNTYCLSRAVSAADGRTPPHRHDFEEGFYLTRGSLTFVAGDRTETLHAGDFVNVGALVAHAVRNESGADAEALILCAPAGFDRFQRDGGYPMEHADAPVVPISDEVRDRLVTAAAKHDIDLDPPAAAFQLAPRAHVVRRDEGDTVDVVGDRYRFLATGEETEGGYALWEATLSPGGGPPPHTHTREEEAFCILEGTITFFTDDGSFEATAGEFVHLPRGQRHWFRNETDRPARTLIHVAPAGLEQLFFEIGTRVEDRTAPIAAPSNEEIRRLGELADQFGIELGGP